MQSIARACLVCSLLALLVGCGTTRVDAPEDCVHIATACASAPAGPGADCRTFANNSSTTDSMCEDRLSACLAACSASDAGTHD